MKTPKLLTYLFLLSALLFLSVGCSEDPFPKIELPIHPKAISLAHLTDKPVKGAKGVAYRVLSPFPANEITSFYDQKLSEIGYLPINNGELGITRQWVYFNQETGEEQQTIEAPAGYTAQWTDKNRETFVWLHVRYQYDGSDESWKTKPIVNCSIVKFSEYIDTLNQIKTYNN